MPSPSVMDAALAWADHELAAQGLECVGPPEKVRERAWSTVWKVPTVGGQVWLKVNNQHTAYEVRLLERLSAAGAPVPRPLATLPANGWTLLPDAGTPMRGNRESVADWCQLASAYAQIQRKLEVEEWSFIPDSRPSALPQLALDLLQDTRIPGFAVPADDHNAVTRAMPDLHGWCAELADSPITNSVDHGDLHSNNAFIAADGASARDGTISIIDWGDASWAHPFASLLVTLRSAAFTLDLGEHSFATDQPDLVRIRDAYLETWTDIADRPSLVHLAELAQRTATISRAMSWQRALMDAPQAALDEFGEAVPGWLAELVSP